MIFTGCIPYSEVPSVPRDCLPEQVRKWNKVERAIEVHSHYNGVRTVLLQQKKECVSSLTIDMEVLVVGQLIENYDAVRPR